MKLWLGNPFQGSLYSDAFSPQVTNEHSYVWAKVGDETRSGRHGAQSDQDGSCGFWPSSATYIPSAWTTLPSSLHFKCLYHFPGSDTSLSYVSGTFIVYDTLSSTWFTSLLHNVWGQEELGSE